MQFLADENFPYPVINTLRHAGYTVQSIQEKNKGLPDIDVIQKAIKENLIILTFDKHFGEILVRYYFPNQPSVIFFRHKGHQPIEIALLLIHYLREQNMDFSNSFTVISSNGIRQNKYHRKK